MPLPLLSSFPYIHPTFALAPLHGTLPTGIPEIDDLTGGGIPRATMTEIYGSASSGRISLMFSLLRQATQRGKFVVIDVQDTFEPESAAAAGIELKRLLSVRCGNARLRYARHLRECAWKAIATARPFYDVTDLVRQVPYCAKDKMEQLAFIGALNGSSAEHRRDALWQVASAGRPVGPLLDAGERIGGHSKPDRVRGSGRRGNFTASSAKLHPNDGGIYNLNAAARRGPPVTSDKWTSRDEAWKQVVEGVRESIDLTQAFTIFSGQSSADVSDVQTSEKCSGGMPCRIKQLGMRCYFGQDIWPRCKRRGFVIPEWFPAAVRAPVPRNGLNSFHVIETLGEAMLQHGTPEHVRSDNGAEMRARRVRAWLETVGTRPLFIEPGSPWENGYCESFNGKLRDECLNGEISYSLKEARVVIEMWRKHYTTRRPHSALGYRPPAPASWIAA